jgi:hypothetical protein
VGNKNYVKWNLAQREVLILPTDTIKVLRNTKAKRGRELYRTPRRNESTMSSLVKSLGVTRLLQL